MSRLAGLLLFATAALSARAQPVVVEGVFSTASDTLVTGEYKHVVEVPAVAGDRIVAVMVSDAFDPYLIVRSPTGAQHENDDCTPGERTRSCVTWQADTTGTFRVIATTYAPGETGAFVLTAGTVSAGLASARAFTCPTPPTDGTLAGEVEYTVAFAPDGSYAGSAALTSAPALQVAVDRVIAGCRAAPVPPDAPQEMQTTRTTFRFAPE